MGKWNVQFSPEVEAWYRAHSVRDRAFFERQVESLETYGNQLSMPRSKYLGANLYELRFKCENVERRVTYTLEPIHQVITLTTFHKQRDNERKQIERARKALRDRKNDA